MHSYFLFGARATGKTTLLKQLVGEDESWYVDLLDPDLEDRYSKRPSLFERDLAQHPVARKTIIIDEIQKVPRLLDVVHKVIGDGSRRFILTGSSARKLKRGGANMLAGRAFVYHLYPLTTEELGNDFTVDTALRWGTLPWVAGCDNDLDRTEYLRAYAHTYLREEIIAEQSVRKLPPFRRFLEVAAQGNGKIINFSRIADDVGVATTTVQSYFSILEDTLIGFLLPAYHSSVRKQQSAAPKFYFFDTGVKRSLEGTLRSDVVEGTYGYGEAFEHLVILEMVRMIDYRRLDWKLSYLRTNHGAEIDLIVARPGKPLVLIEIKSTDSVADRDVSTLNRFASDMPDALCYCLSRDPHPGRIGKSRCLYWVEGLREIIETS
jgi:predicted AAA+ superfamily ATPase